MIAGTDGARGLKPLRRSRPREVLCEAFGGVRLGGIEDCAVAEKHGCARRVVVRDADRGGNVGNGDTPERGALSDCRTDKPGPVQMELGSEQRALGGRTLSMGQVTAADGELVVLPSRRSPRCIASCSRQHV